MGSDRVDNSKGYTMENSVPCCKFCNLGKSVCDVQEFRRMVEMGTMQMIETAKERGLAVRVVNY